MLRDRIDSEHCLAKRTEALACVRYNSRSGSQERGEIGFDFEATQGSVVHERDTDAGVPGHNLETPSPGGEAHCLRLSHPNRAPVLL